jgi:hypothetical protein
MHKYVLSNFICTSLQIVIYKMSSSFIISQFYSLKMFIIHCISADLNLLLTLFIVDDSYYTIIFIW